MWVDAFTETRYGGNPCAVVFDADDVGEQDRIAFTRETGLVECAFIQASDQAEFGARYYMPTGEIPMAGHPTIATVAAMIEAGMVDLATGPAAFTLEVGAGVITIEVAPREDAPPLITMTQLRPEFGRTYEPGAIAALYGLEAGDIILTGTPTGAGARLDPPQYLQPGDEVVVEVEGLGRLINSVADEQVNP